MSTRTGTDRKTELESLEEELDRILAEAGLEGEAALETRLRTEPSTDKGRETVDRVVDAALDVVATEGIRAVNTRAVAREAGVNIATVYQYFEDMDAILIAAAVRDQASRSFVLSRLVIDLAEGRPVRAWVDSLVEMMVMRTVESDRRRAVLAVTQAVPAARPVVALGWQTGAKLLAEGLAYRFGEDPVEYWLPITTAIHSTARLVMDDAMPNLPAEMYRIEQMVVMCSEYLEARIPEGAGSLD